MPGAVVVGTRSVCEGSRGSVVRDVTGAGAALLTRPLIGVSAWSLVVLTEVQSSSRSPPVSPESGFHDQYVQLMVADPRPADRRYVTSACSHRRSDVVSRREPNSPSQTGATPLAARYPQWRVQIPARLAG